MTLRSNKPLYFLILLLTWLQLACKKENHAPAGAGPKGHLTLITGNNQSGTYGQDLADSLVVKIVAPSGSSSSKYSIQVNMAQGNGLIEGIVPNEFLSATLNNGVITLKWRLGCDNPAQKVRVYLYADSLIYNNNAASGVPDDSLTINASGSKPSGWGRSCGCGTPAYNAKISLYLASNGLYSSVDGGTNWYAVKGVPYWSSVTDVQFNDKGWMYVLTANNGIYFSQDIKTWQAINNGILDMRTPTAFTVAGNLMFVSFYFDGPYMTSNNGAFWQKFLVGYGSQRCYLIRRHPNGNIYMFNDWNDLLVSKDTAKTWQLIPLNGQLLNYSAYDLEIGPDGNLYLGSDAATLAIISPLTGQGTFRSFYQYNASTQPTNNINFYNGDVYFLLNANPQPGIYSVNNNWSILNLGFTKTITSYYIRQDGSFLLYSYDGLYYRN